ncbi:hypothetical protein CSV67_03720 [Sporosarcina sp. P2]|uniref:hypothetical protein n=1 Tax=Sporosarcina sp. P2 TaxID=2048251 RepID=UPI000C16F476|nr:hypothetical protein [Sporosarcina sp. P2]PID03759.1 hypothetical protein CSV67_03720 [Sporosarcina sp. P2]
MNCLECRNVISISSNTPYCSDCNREFLKYSLSNGLISWFDSIEKEGVLFIKTEEYLKLRFSERTYSTATIEDLYKEIRSIIKLHLSFYTRGDLLAVILMQRQYFRAGIDSADESYWLLMNEYSVANLLIELAHKIIEYRGASIGEREDGYCNLITAISLARVLTNLENMKFGVFKNVSEEITISEILKRQKQEEIIDVYYEKARSSPHIEKPENYTIKNKALQLKLIDEDKDLATLKNKVDKFLNEKYGLTSEEINAVSLTAFKNNKLFDSYRFEIHSCQLIIIDKREFYEIVKESFEIKYSQFEKVIDLFSLKEVNSEEDLNSKRILYELKSINIVDNLLIFGAYDLFQNAAIFKALHHSSHFTYYFIDSYKNNLELMNSELNEINQHMTSYFVASVADVLLENGYTLPVEKRRIKGERVTLPRFEIKSILNDSEENVLYHLGDIDILAVDKDKKIIYNIEVKYYQPAISFKEMISKDTRRLTSKKTIEKVNARHEILELNIKSVTRFWQIDYDDEYKVESLIITARENFYLTSNDFNFKYYNWNEFNNALISKEL